MKIREALGIEVSKKTIDVMLHEDGRFHQFDNTAKGYKAMLVWLKRQAVMKIPDLIKLDNVK